MRARFVHHKALDTTVGGLFLEIIFLVREKKAFRPDDPRGKYSEDQILLRKPLLGWIPPVLSRNIMTERYESKQEG